MKKTSLPKAMFILLLLSSLPVSSFATSYDFSAENDDGKTIYYNITSEDNRTVEVTFMSLMVGIPFDYYLYRGDVVIPSTVKYNDTTYSVTSIGSSAFQGCSNLTSVTIPSSVTSIGSSTFDNCI